MNEPASRQLFGITGRVIRLLLAASMAGVISFSTPAAASAVFVAACGTGTQKVMHSVVLLQGTAFDAVIGDAMTRMVLPCSSPTAAKWSYPLVLAANMELNADQIVQLGYMRCGAPNGAPCDNVPNDGKVHFIYTPVDNAGGQIKLADGWANGPPIVGHRYRYKIASEAGRWEMCIRDITAGTGAFCEPGGIPQSFGESDAVWWGTETQNTHASMGPCYCNPNNDINMYWMQYSNPANPNWWVVQNATVFKTNLPHPAQYHSDTYDQNFVDDAFRSHTDDW